jgi:hypothetical protein
LEQDISRIWTDLSIGVNAIVAFRHQGFPTERIFTATDRPIRAISMSVDFAEQAITSNYWNIVLPFVTQTGR